VVELGYGGCQESLRGLQPTTGNRIWDHSRPTICTPVQYQQRSQCGSLATSNADTRANIRTPSCHPSRCNRSMSYLWWILCAQWDYGTRESTRYRGIGTYNASRANLTVTASMASPGSVGARA